MKFKPYLYLAGIVILAALSLFFLEATKVTGDKPHAALMRQASLKAENAFTAIREEKLARGYKLSLTEDPNQTGMVGESYTEITTTLGNLEAKRSTTNPNVAAMIVDMFCQLGLKPGDRIAVNLSSSFPCLNIDVLCAMDVMGLQGLVINSVGASTYGANLPEFTYLDMEHFLSENGYLDHETTYFSMGGSQDLGKEMPEEIKEAIQSRLAGYGYQLLEYPDLNENVASRHSLYLEGGPVSCFVNAGGNLLAFAGGSEMVSSGNGILYQTSRNQKGTGLVPLFLSENIPVLHLLNMKSLLPSYGLPIDPVPLPRAGEGSVYQTEYYSKEWAAALAVFNLFCLFLAGRGIRKKRMPL